MVSVALSSRLIAFVALAAAVASAQETTPAPTTPVADAPAPQRTFPDVPLAEKRFEWGNIPYKVDTDVGLIRGVQAGYNICNSTTEGQDSLCQTALFNSIDDFCLWGPQEYGEEVGNIEGEMVAYCTKPGRGTRLIPEGALTGVQWMKTPDYVQAVGFIDQTKINILAGDWGGEMDPHGADLRGNPMGGLVFSNAFGGAPDRPVQVVEWHNFIGGNAFCFKACDPAGPNAAHFCEHVFDRIGCAYNAPNNARDGVFESCLGENQDFPGTYVENGVTRTYTQPPESLGAITTMPYTARVPESSQCTTYTSASIYTGLPQAESRQSTTTSGASTRTSGLSSTRSASSGTGTAGSANTSGAADSSAAAQVSRGLPALAASMVLAVVAGAVVLA